MEIKKHKIILLSQRKEKMKSLYSIAKKHNIPLSTLYTRVHVQGLPVRQALKYRDKRSPIYHVMQGKKHLTTQAGATAVAEWLSNRLRKRVTKDMIIGRMYRKRTEEITFEGFTIVREGIK